MNTDQNDDIKTYRFAFQPSCDVNNRRLRALQAVPVFECSKVVHPGANTAQASGESKNSDYLVLWEKEFIEEVLVFFHERLSANSTVGEQSFQIGVPLSLRTALSDGYFEWFSDLLSLYRIEPKKLVLHLCESEHTMFEEANDVLCALSSAGSTICVDGYFADGPCFEILSNPFIKFFNCDSLVPKAALSSDLARRYLRGLVALADQLKKTVILNGIDTIQELDLVADLRGTWFQGIMAGGTLAPCELSRYIDSLRTFPPIGE